MRPKVEPQEMVVHYLLTRRNEREFQFRPDHWEAEAYRAAFEARGADVQYDQATGLMTIRHSAKLTTLLSDAEIRDDRRLLLLGALGFFGIKLGVIVACVIAVVIGASAVTAWFGFLAVLCIGGAAFERKYRKERLILAGLFLGIAALGLPWNNWAR